MSAHRSIRPAAFALGIAILVAGLMYVVLVGWPKLRTARASAAWPTVDGEITASSVEEQRAGSRRTYLARVEYQYTVKQKVYGGTTIRFGGDYRETDSAAAESIAAKYPIGEPVTVHYDPLHPATAVLEPGGGVNSYAVLSLGLAIMAAGLTIVVPLVPRMWVGDDHTSQQLRDPHILARFRRWSTATSEEKAE